MANILLFGAGKSASYLIRYILERAQERNYVLHVCDLQTAHLLTQFPHHQDHLRCHAVSIEDRRESARLVQEADIVISLLPAFLHAKVAVLCLELKKNLVTASYVDEAMQNMHEEVKAAGLCFMNEAGLDPGIDHMSAMKLIHELKEEGADILSFESFTGGLVAPANDTNPWHYKLSWNPRNVVLAGSGSAARYLDKNELRFVSYPQLFQRTQLFDHAVYGSFEGYPNRDSLSYQTRYGLEKAETLLRGTLRRKGYCSSWNILVQLGLTDDSFEMMLPDDSTGRRFLNSFLPWHPQKSVEEKLMSIPGLQCSDADMARLEYLGLLSTTYRLPKTKGSPAQLLQAIMEEKWKLEDNDRDLVVMIHRIGYRLNGETGVAESSLAVEGEDRLYTAMAKTVGLPAALCAEAILEGTFTHKGVLIPIQPEIYLPVLERLSGMGINFIEKREKAKQPF